MADGEILELSKALAQLQGVTCYAADCSRDAIRDEIRRILWNRLSDKEKKVKWELSLAQWRY